MKQNVDKPTSNTPSADPVSTPVVITDPDTGQTIRDKEIQRQVIVKIKRNWKELAAEFLLVLAAVFLGFLADSLREKSEDRQKERKYIRSLIDDLEIDKMISDTLYKKVGNQAILLDSLERLLLNGDLKNPEIVRRCYESATALNYYTDFLIGGTITQLLSSGSMRLIKKQEIARQIMLYHGRMKFMEDIKRAYIKSIEDCYNSHHEIFDIESMWINPKERFRYLYVNKKQMRLMDFNDIQKRKFIMLLERAKGQSAIYAEEHRKINEEANWLSENLRDEYNLKRLEENN